MGQNVESIKLTLDHQNDPQSLRAREVVNERRTTDTLKGRLVDKQGLAYKQRLLRTLIFSL
jgi:hypothetical protein